MKKYASMLGLVSLAVSLSAIDNVSKKDYVWNESHQGQNRIFQELYVFNGFSFEVPPTAGQEQVRNAYINKYIDVIYQKISDEREKDPIRWDNKKLDRCLMYEYNKLKDKLRIIRVSNSEGKLCHDPIYQVYPEVGAITLDGGALISGRFAKVTEIYGEWQ